jgi:hypothetical protein
MDGTTGDSTVSEGGSMSDGPTGDSTVSEGGSTEAGSMDGGTGDSATSDAGDAAVACDKTARAACTSSSANCLLIDGFDVVDDAGMPQVPPKLPANAAGITGTWVVSADSTDGGITLPNPLQATARTDDAGDPFGMWFYSSGHPIYADFEVTRFKGSDGGDATWDATQYSGIQFWAKFGGADGGAITGASTYPPTFSVGDPSLGYQIAYTHPLDGLTTTWQLIYVPFCALNLPMPDAGAFDRTKFGALAWTAASPQGIWVDQVYLVK